ncbi:MAG: hypothetical protein JXB48_22270 [Candidatus Latescibacteria bacterium]|nr:hypothetical protein [Candidatus Latescibacterota bacterium]
MGVHTVGIVIGIGAVRSTVSVVIVFAIVIIGDRLVDAETRVWNADGRLPRLRSFDGDTFFSVERFSETLVGKKQAQQKQYRFFH